VLDYLTYSTLPVENWLFRSPKPKCLPLCLPLVAASKVELFRARLFQRCLSVVGPLMELFGIHLLQ
jgi:hypothetical protein